MVPQLSVADTKPECELVRGPGWLPEQGRGRSLAQCVSGRETGVHCWEKHYAATMKTVVPTVTWLKSHSASGMCIRMQPCEAE